MVKIIDDNKSMPVRIREYEDILIEIVSTQEKLNPEMLIAKELHCAVYNDDDSKFELLFKKLKEKQRNEDFLRICKFYYFWCRRPKVFDVLSPDFKLIVMTSIIEKMTSDEKYLTLDQWLKQAVSSSSLVISNPTELEAALKTYYAQYGSTRKIYKFFNDHYPEPDKKILLESLTILQHDQSTDNITERQPKDINEFVQFLMGARNTFVHRATWCQIGSVSEHEIPSTRSTYYGSSLLTKMNGKIYEIEQTKCHIEAILDGFEKAFFHYYENL